MLISKITRSYSKSINTRTYGAPESWVKIEATYEAIVESSDDPMKVSAMLHDQAKKEVIDATNAVIEKIKQGNANLQNTMAGQSTPAPTGPTIPGPSVPPRSL
jgi:hypothetical protein